MRLNNHTKSLIYCFVSINNCMVNDCSVQHAIDVSLDANKL